MVCFEEDTVTSIPEERPRKSRIRGLHPKPILVVAPNLEARVDIFRALDRAGHLVATSSTGLDGLKYAARSKPGLAVVDWNLPDILATTLVDTLRRMAPDAPIIALVRPGQRIAKDDAGETLDRILEFPVAEEKLLECVDSLLSRRTRLAI